MAANEKCGVIAAYVFDERKLNDYLYQGLRGVQHRGQESFGICVINHEINGPLVYPGLIRDSHKFSEDIKNVEGTCGIGHIRYSTTGKSSIQNAQPIIITTKYGIRCSFAFNGNIVNYSELRNLNNDYDFKTTSDTEVLALMLMNNLGRKTLDEIYAENALRIIGAYSAVMLIEDKKPKIAAVRDPFGIRPLCIGSNENGFFVASESVAFDDSYMGVNFLRDVMPGELVVIDEDGIHSYPIFNFKPKHCMFEYVYKARPESVIDGKFIYDVRKRMGKFLGLRYRPNAHFAGAIPDSGRSILIGYSETSGIPVEEIFVKDRYHDKRSFLEPEDKDRKKVVGSKLNVIGKLIEGKDIVIVDDSRVRGTSGNQYAQLVKKANSVHFAFACPPIIDQCPYGVDFYRSELPARRYRDRPHEEVCLSVAKDLGVTSVYHNTIDDLISAIGLPKDELCLGCLTGIYPHERIPERFKEMIKI
ncbi:MAG: amidophosphoribosyltransferase [Candidatus Aenigmatarchaeota archaeon]